MRSWKSELNYPVSLQKVGSYYRISNTRTGMEAYRERIAQQNVSNVHWEFICANYEIVHIGNQSATDIPK